MGMKEWALSKGVTITHTGFNLDRSNCWKHDAFFETSYDGTDPEKFGGAQLVQQEPDASIFLMGN
jgi:glutamine synthetase